MSNARDKANIPALNFSSTGIDDNATSTAITIDSSEKVGIGTTTPDTLLHLESDTPHIRITDTNNSRVTLSTRLEFYGTDGSAGNIGMSAGILQIVHDHAKPVIFKNSNTERMRIDTSTGNVGIGTSSPSARLETKNATDGSTFAFQATNDNDHEIVQIGAQSDGDGYLTVHGQGASTNIKVQLHSDGDSYFTGGNVGIGTTSPSNKLHIIGNAQIENTSASGNAWYYAKNADKTYLMGVRGSSGDALSFYDATTDVERMQIASSGDVTFNNDGADADFFIKDDNNSTLFYAHGGASLPYVKTAGVRWHDSDNEGGLSRHQTVTGSVTAPASGTTIELVQVGHTNICNVSIIAQQTTSSGGVAYRTVGAYHGLGTGGTVTESYLGGGVTDINIFYQNGGTNAYTINATITYTGTAPTVYFTVDGKASQNFEKLV